MPKYGGGTPGVGIPKPTTYTPPVTGGEPGEPSAMGNGFIVDIDLLASYGVTLLPIADGMGTSLSDINVKEQSLTSAGYPAWGDGEIGEAYHKFYVEQAEPLLKSAEDIRQGIYNVADKMGVTSVNYKKTEDASTV